tara:strand:+ start:171 stop:701 length:531 start_codon:yes stop_codon:yes gene_type:complete
MLAEFTRGVRDAFAGTDVKAGETMRAWGDFVVSSHASFVPAQVVALARGVYDAFVLTSVMLVLSVCYHRTRESNSAVARVELCSTSALFVYGLAQARVCPHALLQGFELACAGLVLATYAASFRLVHTPAAYDLWHPLGLHVVPAAWALAVAVWHECLLCGQPFAQVDPRLQDARA